MKKNQKLFEAISYETKELSKNGNYASSVAITPCPYFPNKIVAGAYSCDPCQFNGGCTENLTVRCSYRHFMQSDIKVKVHEEENAWWYYFFQAIGSKNYDPEYADHLRIDGVLPEVAAEKASI